MTTTVASGEVRERARQAYRVSVAAGAGLSGKALGEQFGRSERWGRARIAEVRSALPRPERRAAGSPSRHNDERSAGAAAAAESERQPHGTDAAIDMTQARDSAAPVPIGARFVAWLGFVFGSVMSVAANVLHAWLPADERPAGWSPSIAQQVGSAVWPVGLLLSVEVLSRVRWAPGMWWALARYGGAGTVAVGSAIISYGHLHEVLLAWEYGPLGAAVGPLVLDGLMVVSGFALLAMSRVPEGSADPGITSSGTDSATAAAVEPPATDLGATSAGGTDA
jgi:hypothetical protein